MPESPRFLLGNGERLTSAVALPNTGGSKRTAYTVQEARARLTPFVQTTASEMSSLPRLACPGDQSVGLVTLHPEWIAKSYFPQRLLSEFHLRSIGSRPATVTPEKWTREGEPRPSPTTQLFVAGERRAFGDWADYLRGRGEDTTVDAQLPRLESVRLPSSNDRLKSGAVAVANEAGLLELVLHANALPASAFILDGFIRFARELDVSVDLDRILFAGGLCFMPARASGRALEQLAAFSFLRAARPMPRMRTESPFERNLGSPIPEECAPPDVDAVNPDLRVAVFDGGVGERSVIRRWVTVHDAHQVGSPNARSVEHGSKVTSALLFGSFEPDAAPARPYAVVDHYRVVDSATGADPEMYDVLRRIDAILSQRRHEFVNLSIGPYVAVDDDDVHSWTAILDQYLADGSTLATVAVGNSGESDRPSGNARIQAPSDAVNGLAVGAADSVRDGWQKAAYSSIGPGRFPGIIKPDVLAFGGCAREPFYVYPARDAYPVSIAGTSFAAPAALRVAVGIRAHFGGRLSPLALKALLIHAADQRGGSLVEVGWGKVPEDLERIVICPDNTARVVYQGELFPAQALRAQIPLPDEQFGGLTTISATMCIATAVDPEDPGSYTRAGLDIHFRPHADRFESGATHAKTAPFFRRADFETEDEQREFSLKWETARRHSQRFRDSSLLRPVFDIHYVAREGGGSAGGHADPIKYALIVDVFNSKTPDLYDRILRTYATILEPVLPIVDIPIELQ